MTQNNPHKYRTNEFMWKGCDILATTNYTNIADIKNYWLNNIAPNYFDLENVNNYQTGIFGYINEVMAESVEDGFNAVNIARREFYPISSQYISSLYTMATIQKIDPPMTTPAQCRAALIIPQLEIIENSTPTADGIYECTIDSCLKMDADNIPFMIDYPIKILSVKSDNGSWTHTIHYDVNVNNSLSSETNATYISNKILNIDGVNYTILFLDTIRQLECVSISTILQKDVTLATASFEVEFEGNIANFEVFYIASQNSPEVQLKKVIYNGTIPNEPFVYYEIINRNRIRFTFPKNNIFTPGYNSEIIVNVYTSLGSDGNFDSYAGDIICSSNSEKYPYNNQMTIIAKALGSATNGKDAQSEEDFRNQVIKAYSTNNTITTVHDLQVYFDELSDDIQNTRVMFRKIRDDAFIRQFGAYVLMKDDDENIVPTNTLDLIFNKSEVMDVKDGASRIMIKPGTTFVYESESSYNLRIDHGTKIPDIDSYESSHTFTNPFLIGVNLRPNIIGYYLNSVDDIKSLQYSYVNDKTPNQFITNKFSIYRNAINGSNYYVLSIPLMAAASDFDIATVLTINDKTDPANMIIAEQNGSVVDMSYIFDAELGYGYVKQIIRYTDGTEFEIQASTAVKADGSHVTGYDTVYDISEEFVKGDILATKKVDDLGNLTVVGDLNNVLYDNDLYIPFVIDKYIEESNSIELRAYLSTDDAINLQGQITITHGIFNKDGTENDYLAVQMDDLEVELSALYNNVGNNLSHKYSEYTNLSKYTLTNIYLTDPLSKVKFVQSYSYIRSVLDFSPGETEDDYIIHISNVPVLQASWATRSSNYSYFINKLNMIQTSLEVSNKVLENNFNINLMFYNTYGKAKFYHVGNGASGSELLDSIRCQFRFGVSVYALTDITSFLERFRAYVKDFIEDFTSITTSGQSTYILNLIAELKNNFSELVYLEYYGFNSYNYRAQKIIGPNLEDYTEGYIPEFVNIGTAYTVDGVPYPDIVVEVLES